MSASEREETKQQLEAIIAGEGDGIDLDTPFHWVIEDLESPIPFFEQLPSLIPPDSILYFEGTSIVPPLANFYSAHRALNPVAVVRDTIAPVPDIYHVAFSSEVLTGLRSFSEQRAVPVMFDHIKAYCGQHLLFTFHDAFCGWLRVSDRIPEPKVAQFCKALRVTCRREATQERDLKELQNILRAIEKSAQAPIRGRRQSWLSRFWRRLMQND